MTVHSEVAPALAGSAVTGTSAVVSLISASLPVLQMLSLAVSLLVGVLTALYTVQKILDRREVRLARIQAHEEAQAKLAEAAKHAVLIVEAAKVLAPTIAAEASESK
jgi:hypothetical protein